MADIVKSLSVAKIGDSVWVLNRHRRTWSARVIIGMNKVSLLLTGAKYDKKTGAPRSLRGYSPDSFIMGVDERFAHEALELRFKLRNHVEAVEDPNILIQIAKLIGWDGFDHLTRKEKADVTP